MVSFSRCENAIAKRTGKAVRSATCLTVFWGTRSGDGCAAMRRGKGIAVARTDEEGQVPIIFGLNNEP